MSEPKFTKGPWHRNIKPASHYPTVFAGRNTHVAYVKTTILSEAEIEANLALIAAAPEMYAVLEAISNHSILQAGFRPSELASIDALLAKARGEST